MNANIEGADKLPKKRGRPAKVDAIPVKAGPEGVSLGEDKSERITLMNKRLQMQWDGQSPTLSITDRAMRLRIAMKKHGWLDLIGYLDINERSNPCNNNPQHRTVKDCLA